jgi:hypothetical protein
MLVILHGPRARHPERPATLAVDWLLALIASAVRVTAEADEKVRGVVCRRYDALADLRHALERANGSLAKPLHAQNGTSSESESIGPTSHSPGWPL